MSDYQIREGFIRSTRRLTISLGEAPRSFNVAVQGDLDKPGGEPIVAVLPTFGLTREEWRMMVPAVDALFEEWKR